MPVRQLGRRHFLRGTGGALLSIPFLQSLAPKTARAQAPDSRFFVAFLTMHGGVWPENMYPGDHTLTNSHSLYSDHAIRWGRLAAGSSTGQVALSSVLTSTSGSMPQSLIDQMMVIRGLDVATRLGHSSGQLGNYERADHRDNASLYVPTIDQVLASWPGFYGSGDPYLLRSMHVGGGLSWVERSSGVQAMEPATSPDVLFRMLLSDVSLQAPTPTPSIPVSNEGRTPVLNRVVEHYNQLVNGAFGDSRRLSANDKARLNDHMDMVADLARRFDAAAPAGAVAKASGVGAACDPQSGNTGNTQTSGDMYSPRYENLKAWHQDFNAVFAAAISCGASRIGTMRIASPFHQSPSFTVDWEQWHEPIAHRASYTQERWAREGNLPEHPQDTLVTAKNNFYREVYVDLIGRLHDIDAGDGTSVLDKGLVMWVQESGPYTHHADSIPVVTAGSANGYFNTGHFFDLRKRDNPTFPDRSGENTILHDKRRAGILYNQWLSNILQSMGMSPSEFHRNHPEGWAGYGCAETVLNEQYPQRLFNDANEKIAKVTSGT